MPTRPSTAATTVMMAQMQPFSATYPSNVNRAPLNTSPEAKAH
jgi:hypothetical protein